MLSWNIPAVSPPSSKSTKATASSAVEPGTRSVASTDDAPAEGSKRGLGPVLLDWMVSAWGAMASGDDSIELSWCNSGSKAAHPNAGELSYAGRLLGGGVIDDSSGLLKVL